ncbi:hypothetical protein TrCOL_g4893 [Triparma columacea]|uniref:Uncharacterized protein n=1 Tax=Triparma columacea TaxID=722753 RepID=A0A9W7GB88_9STRA|nr:hypothetical protein TrCOL_g4893 [Triparma columacea]
MPFGLSTKKAKKSDSAPATPPKSSSPLPPTSSSNSLPTPPPSNPTSSKTVTHTSQKDRIKYELDQMVPLQIDLDGNKLQLENNGVWEIQETEAVRLRAEISTLTATVSSKSSEVEALLKSSQGGSEVTNALNFKLEVLMDMLSIARADVTKTERMLEKEKIIADEYRKELERVLEICEKKGWDVGEVGGVGGE